MEGAPEARLYIITLRMRPPGGFAQLRGAGVQGDVWRPRIHDEGDGTPSPMSFSMAAPSSSNQIWKDLDVISEDGQIDGDVQRAMAIHLVSGRTGVHDANRIGADPIILIGRRSAVLVPASRYPRQRNSVTEEHS